MRPVSRTRAALVSLVAALATAALALAPATAAAADSAAAPGTESAGPPVRFATYNIHAGAGEDNVFDLDRTAAAIRGLHADVVGLEEVDVHWGDRSQWLDTITELGSRLGMHTGYAPIYSLDPVDPGDPRREYGVAVLSRFPIEDLENHEITRLSTQVPDPVPEPAPGFLEATISLRGMRTHVYVTHLDYRPDPSVRAMQVDDTRRILAEDPPGEPQVLLGDLNAEVGSPELAPLWQDLRDAWTTAPVRRGEPGLTYPAAVPTKRIDVVSVDPRTRVLRAEVPSDELSTTASDHRPVVATVLLPPRAH
jgi:endonuclease/exonuclease/phosphatase family metal-dependent hydrolase